MAKYVYPAVFSEEKNGQYSVSFPDLESCITCGDSLSQSIENAEDALGLVLTMYEDDKVPFSLPSNIKELIMPDENSFATLIYCDTVEYRKKNDNRAVKKTLTIPNWLNTLSEKAGINFSQVLQEALMKKLDIED